MYARFLEIEITGRCPYRCRHCYGSFPRPGELSLQVFQKVVQQARGRFDCIIISGGEPFLHPDISEMVRAASADFAVFITTSGYGLTDRHLDTIQHKAVLVFGLDGIEATHDTYRNSPGAYRMLIEAMDRTRNLPKEIIVTLWKGVIDQIDTVIALAESYNAIVHFNALIPVGRAAENPDLSPAATELDMLYERLYRMKMHGGSVMTDLYRVTGDDRHAGIDLFCKGRFNITPEGDVRPCEFHTTVFGNIHNSPLGDIIRHANTTRLIQSREKGFRDCIPDTMNNPFDYHTQICHALARCGC